MQVANFDMREEAEAIPIADIAEAAPEAIQAVLNEVCPPQQGVEGRGTLHSTLVRLPYERTLKHTLGCLRVNLATISLSKCVDFPPPTMSHRALGPVLGQPSP